MTKLSHIVGLACLATLVVCLAVVFTGGHPDDLLRDIGDLYHRVVS